MGCRPAANAQRQHLTIPYFVNGYSRSLISNQALFHGKYFILDAMLSVFSGHLHQLSCPDVQRLRTTATNWHNDYQYKFLWSGMYGWCKEYAKSSPAKKRRVTNIERVLERNVWEDEALSTRTVPRPISSPRLAVVVRALVMAAAKSTCMSSTIGLYR